jgi:hypothetical protein
VTFVTQSIAIIAELLIDVLTGLGGASQEKVSSPHFFGSILKTGFAAFASDQDIFLSILES